jgi:hypothetical protein
MNHIQTSFSGIQFVDWTLWLPLTVHYLGLRYGPIRPTVLRFAALNSRNNATNMHCLPGQPGLFPFDDDDERGFFARRQARQRLPHTSCRLLPGNFPMARVFPGLLPPFRSVLVDTTNPASQADDLALEEESPSLRSHFYRTDVNVYATGRQQFAWCTPCHDLDRPPANFRHAFVVYKTKCVQAV